MKFVTFAAILISSMLLLGAAVFAENVSWGKVGPHDRLLARDVIEKSSKWFGKHKETITFPPKGHESFARLSAIHVVDKGGPKNFGSATLIHGGPGSNTATIQITSQSRRALNMVVEYYGVPF